MSAALGRWQEAERSLSSGDVNRAAARLPSRQGWILRGLHALQGGDREQVEAVGSTADA